MVGLRGLRMLGSAALLLPRGHGHPAAERPARRPGQDKVAGKEKWGSRLSNRWALGSCS